MEFKVSMDLFLGTQIIHTPYILKTLTNTYTYIHRHWGKSIDRMEVTDETSYFWRDIEKANSVYMYGSA